MTDPRQLPYLMRLLDDESEVVRAAVAEQLSSYGPALYDELARLPAPPSPQERRLVQQLLEENNRRWLRENWDSWKHAGSDLEKLEEAHALLAEFQYGRSYPLALGDLLDDLAEEYDERYPERDVMGLAQFLFDVKQLQGNREDYYNPKNSNLIFVIESRLGIPISLAMVYILVGQRLGLDIYGCNTPGHFLARARALDKVYLVDCFNGGRFLSVEDVSNASAEPERTMANLLDSPPQVTTILERVLTNLHYAYQQSGQNDEAQLVLDLSENL